MEGASVSAYKGLRSSWNRRGYERIDGSSGGGRSPRTRVRVATASGADFCGTSRRSRFWRFRISPRLRLRRRMKLNLRFSLKKFFVGLREAYVNMMIRFANSRMIGGGAGGFAGEGLAGFGMAPLKEYDEKMIVQIYKSLLAQAHNQGQLVPSHGLGSAAATASGVRLSVVDTELLKFAN